MSMEVACVACGRRLRLGEGLSGRPVRCPACGADWWAPGDDAPPAAEDDDLAPVELEEKRRPR